MTKESKIAGLGKYLTRSTRDDGTKFYHFMDGDEDSFEEIKELRDIFLEHYRVDDLDYEIFSDACDMLEEIYNDTKQENDGLELVEDMIYERASDRASIMTYDRLQYLNNYTEEDISNVMHEYDMRSIAEACAVWYDRQVEQAAIIIKDWINR